MNKIFFIHILLYFSYFSYTQTVTWSKYYDPSVDGEFIDFIDKNESGYLMGISIFCSGTSWTGCTYMVSIGNDGLILKDTFYNKDELFNVMAISRINKHYIKKGSNKLLAMVVSYYNDDLYYPSIALIDSELNIKNLKIYKSQDTIEHIQISTIFPYGTKTVMVTRSFNNKIDPQEVKPVLVIIDDTLGQIAQHKVKGLEEYRLLDNPNFVKLKDGTIACASNVYKYGDNISNGDLHHAVMRFDTAGDMKWSKIYSEVNFLYADFYNTDIIELKNGNLVFAGSRKLTFEDWDGHGSLNPFYIQCISPNGDSLWRMEFRQDYPRYGVVLQQLDNGDFIGGGYRSCQACFPDSMAGNPGWLFCMSSEGKMKWERYYINPINDNNAAYVFRKLVICDDGGILVGTEGSDVKNKSGLWLLKLDSMGCLTPDCAGTELYTSIKDEKGNWKDLKEIFFSIYPNPAKDVLNINFFSPQPGRKMEIMVSGMNGVVLYKAEINNEKHIEQINVSGYKPGSYVFSLLMNGKVVQSEWMMKE